MNGESSASERVTQLDGLRGLAALGVLVYHYVHFGGDPKLYPFAAYQPFAWVYARGWLLVDFFFLLSGIVMTHRYLAPIAKQALSARSFFWLRLSRIYPLHLAGLGVTALLQWYRLWHDQAALIYPNRDLYHFALNLVFLHAGAFEEGWSYDAPSWSVAVEVFAYTAFFVLARRSGRYASAAVVAFVASFVLYTSTLNYPLLNPSVGRGLFGFFLGSLIYLGLRGTAARKLGGKLGVAALVALAAAIAMSQKVGQNVFIGGDGVRTGVHYGFSVFPLLLVAALEVRPLARLLSLRPFTFLGDISYSVYLLHVPVQMGVLMYAEATGTALPTAQPAFLLTFMAVVLALSTLAHRFFEVPVRARVRRAALSSPHA